MTLEQLLSDEPGGPETIRLPALARLLGVAPATVAAWCKAGRLPPFVQLGPKTRVFRVDALRPFLLQLHVCAAFGGGEE